jgi:hypothetical protein
MEKVEDIYALPFPKEDAIALAQFFDVELASARKCCMNPPSTAPRRKLQPKNHSPVDPISSIWMSSERVHHSSP